MENLDIYTNLMKIDLGAISHNYVELKKYIQAKNSTSEVGLVLKSNAYAIGIKEVAPIVYAAGARKFFVMWIGEAITLRKMLPDAVIFVLSGVLPNTEQVLIEHSLIPVLYNETQLKRWMDYAKSTNQRLKCVIKFDTGMNRMGISDDNTGIIKEWNVENALDIEYVMSHMYINSGENPRQLARLNALRENLPGFKTSFSDTYSAFLDKHWYSDLFRVGRALYGVFDRKLNAADYPRLTKCAFSVEARVLQIKEVKRGETVSYGATYAFDRDTRVATVGIGYSHGLPAILGNKGWMKVNGKVAKIIGSVTMEYTMLDITDCGDVPLESWITVLDSEDDVDAMSAIAGVTSLEIMASFSKGVQKKTYYNSFGCCGNRL